ncbi:MAG: efflux RND transporter periplasmic adaptor subunit [Planctomycetes bacterium]|nr:efflux RND transporter periplasmic adaptor subunit [Planctomycetota bacterium]
MRSIDRCLIALLLVGTGCEKPSSAVDSATTASRTTNPDAMCSEHGVLEALCTKCNPQLIPVFQSKGDWCKEHGFPESICPICHPERGGRPSEDRLPTAAMPDDGAPADRTRVRLKTKQVAGLVGIETAKAIEWTGQPELEASATIVYDATRTALVNARARGVVRTLHVDVGSRVDAESPLALIESATVAADRSRLQAARSRVQNAEATHARVKTLKDKGVSAGKDVLAAQLEWDSARAELETLEAAIGMLGSVPADGNRYTITSPIAGVVTKRLVSIGKLVEDAEPLFEIIDTSKMWAEVDTPEADLAAVAVGQSASLSFDSLSGRKFEGAIDYIAPEVDRTTRTTIARIPLANPDGALRANLFGSARISVGVSRSRVMVPRRSVERAKTVSLLFVRLAADDYEARRVTLGPATDGDRVEIVTGVQAGEDVVTAGSFLLKTETLKGSIGAGCCDDAGKK